MKYEGSNVTVSRRVRGSGTGYTEVLGTSNAHVTSADRMRLALSANASYSFDDFALLADGGEPIETVIYAHNDGNEQTSMTVNGVTTSMSYDAWGRLTRRTQGAYQADYAYHYGGKLVEVISDFPGEGTVAYDYGGDQKRRERAVSGGDTKWYRWSRGWNLLNEEDGSGNLERNYIGRLAHIDGDTPSTGEYAFYMQDHLGSTRGIYDSAKARVGGYQFSPYGGVYAASAFAGATRQYTGHHWDTASALDFAPYRYYSPAMARWLTRDPLGMVDGPNVYAYVRGNPANVFDPLGLSACKDKCRDEFNDCRDRVTERYEEVVAHIEAELAECNLGATAICTTSCAIGCLGLVVGYPACMAVCLTTCIGTTLASCRARAANQGKAAATHRNIGYENCRLQREECLAGCKC